MYYRDQHVALIVPCYNEEAAIEAVVHGFRDAMPEIDVYVFDNNSTDRTALVARNAGAKVVSVQLLVREMLYAVCLPTLMLIST